MIFRIYEQIKKLRDASIVRRSHTLRILRERTVAEHSHGICITILELYKAYHAMPRAELLAAACVHDLSETETGDIPANAKWKYPELKMVANAISTQYEKMHDLRYELTEEEAKTLAWADAFDFGLYALEEITSGNRYLEVPAARIYWRLKERPVAAVNGDVTVAWKATEELCEEIECNVSRHKLNEVRKDM